MSTEKSKISPKGLLDDKLSILKTHFPQAICVKTDSEGNKSFEIDAVKLQSFLNGGESVLANTPDAPKVGCELSWVGKKFAYQDAFQAGEKLVKLEEKQSKNSDKTENVVLIGDNIEALKLLRQNYHNSIKCIYIDPPYNTGNDDFTYADRFAETGEQICEALGYDEKYKDFIKNMYSASTHSAWMSFMLSRLLLAKELLSDDGVIFISIDDNEQANLKILCAEVFGEGNFISCMAWRKTDNQANIGDIARVKEYILLYSKSSESFSLNKMVLTEKAKKEYRYSDEKGVFRRSILLDKTRGRHKYDISTPSGSTLSGPWMIKEELFYELEEKGLIYWATGGNELPHGKIYLHDSDGQIASDWLGIEFGSNQQASLDIEELFGIRIFDFSKPVSLIRHFITIATNPNDIILDFFAGSGTTGEAVMQLNAEDGGKRKFILVQLDEPIDAKKPAYEFCKENKLEPVISSITIERLNRAGDKIIAEKPELANALDIGYKVFSIHDDAEAKFINRDIAEIAQTKLFEEYSNIKNTPGLYSRENLIYNSYFYNSIPLSTAYTELKKDTLYQANNHYFCFGEVDRAELESFLDEHSEGVFTIFCMDGYATDSFIHTCEAHLMQIAPNITYKVHG